jgi:hypothetical protein
VFSLPPQIRKWFWISVALMGVQMYLNTGTLSAYAATMNNPAMYDGYIVNLDWPQYVANYKFITGADPSQWAGGYVLRRVLLYLVGYPFLKLFGFYTGSMITIFLCIFISYFFFIKFVGKEFGNAGAGIAMALLCTYTGIMYWIGSPFVHNLIVPLCLWIYLLLYKMQRNGLRFNYLALAIIGILFTGYDLLPLFAPGILVLILLNRNFAFTQRLLLIVFALLMFVGPPLLVRWWIHTRAENFPLGGNDNSYTIIINSYLHVLNSIPAWWERTKLVPATLMRCFLHGNFYGLPLLFIVLWTYGRWVLKFKLNRIENTILYSILFLFLFNNMAPPYEGEWQMWGDWLARLYQPLFIVMVMYVVRLGAHVYVVRGSKLLFSSALALTVVFNILVNTGGLYASPLTSRVYGNFYKHGAGDSYLKNIRYFGARPLGFPVHYQTEIQKQE